MYTELVWQGLSLQCFLRKYSVIFRKVLFTLIDDSFMCEDLPLFIKYTGRKVIVSKFKFFILKLWEFARLFAAMACVNLVFPPQKLNSNDTLQRDTRGFNAAFSHWIPSVSVVQFMVQMSKLNGHRERIFVVELELKLCSPFHYEQIVWENSDIKWMKVPSFS